MKRFVSLLLTLTLIMACSVSVFAAGGSETKDGVPSSGNAYIEAVYDAPKQVVHTYSVTIAWAQEGTLTYTDNTTVYTWNTNDLKYDTSLAGTPGWNTEGAKIAITVTNRSDEAITAVCNDPTPVTVNSITGSYDQSTLNISTVAPADYTQIDAVSADVPSATATYSITGVDGAITAGGNIGTITVNISVASAPAIPEP